jgi:hypothetical protein
MIVGLWRAHHGLNLTPSIAQTIPIGYVSLCEFPKPSFKTALTSQIRPNLSQSWSDLAVLCRLPVLRYVSSYLPRLGHNTSLNHKSTGDEVGLCPSMTREGVTVRQNTNGLFGK